MLNIGCHLSVAKGFEAMGKDALQINANTFQFFSRNPRGGKAKAVDLKDIAVLQKIIDNNNFAPLLAHAPYTLNACSADEKVRNFASLAMYEDLERMELLPGNYYNFHPGSHTGQGVEVGIEYITDLLNRMIKPEQKTIVLLETMAGKGSEIGRTFEELQEIIERIECNEKIGVCMDTCHIYDGGYDIVNDLDGVLEHFEKIIGLKKLYAIHLNDSMNGMGSHKDRHAKIGQGRLGIAAIERVINHPQLRHLPFYLETPNELEGYGEEIALLRGLYK